MPNTTYSVSQVARTIKKSPQTIRAWTDRYRVYLSASATPDSGDERKYTDADLLVLATVAHLAGQGQRHDAIAPMIAAGERIEPSGMPERADNMQKTDKSALIANDLLNRIIVRYEARIDELEDKLWEAEAARRNAEIGAARMAGRFETMHRRHWWQVWRPEKPEV